MSQLIDLVGPYRNQSETFFYPSSTGSELVINPMPAPANEILDVDENPMILSAVPKSAA
ncbi:MAG: hypothetical protein CM1200mP24_01110 [Gammaproteobacteria bacterium]|nr:MAG: hypothetical protein CM1200mP24_01110 [Gammaproteobacteria bacterium]